jgi:uncharacterized protein involved in exopolysaccharide biosynthesis
MADITGTRRATLNDDEISLLAIGNAFLRRRRLVISLMFGGAMLGLAAGLLTPRKYLSSATFIPSESEGTTSTIAAAASQFGIRLPNTDNESWGPAAYVELLTSRALLEPITRDTVIVAEEGNRRATMMEVLRVDPASPQRTERAVRRLRGMIQAGEVNSLRGVKVNVTSEFPSVSHQLAERLVSGINRFNLETRKTRAAAERHFIAEQAAEAEQALRSAEERLRFFLRGNRTITMSSMAALERDRLQREVMLRQELHTSWLKNREEARIREVRDTPVITVIEAPSVAVRPESRRTLLKIVVGAVGGFLVAAAAVLLGMLFSRARRSPAEESQEFFELIEQVRPKFLRRTAR